MRNTIMCPDMYMPHNKKNFIRDLCLLIKIVSANLHIFLCTASSTRFLNAAPITAIRNYVANHIINTNHRAFK